MEIITKSDQETINLANKTAPYIKGGEIILLYGDLGAGKTLFVKGLVKALGFKDIVVSPTFSLMKIYHEVGDLKKNKVKKLCHLDLYRLENEQEIIELGILDYFKESETVCLIEWPEKISKILPRKPIEIFFTHIDENSRKIIIKGLNGINN